MPHSEIFGSKPIPGSPKLIAGYHVLHRLLLPRHPPNALLALDPIQRRTGLSRRPFVQRPRLSSTPHGAAPVGSHTFPAPRPGKARELSVSVLDLEQNRLRDSAIRRPQVTPTLGRTSGSDVSLSSRCHLSSGSDGRTRTPRALQCDPVVEPVGIEPTTPCLQSRCSPS